MKIQREKELYSKQIFKLIAVMALFAGALISRLDAQDKLPVERYAVYVASNNGGDKRDTLRYAGTDANRLAKTMMDIGGVKTENSIILVDPKKEEVDATLQSMSKKIELNKSLSKRTEFMFYYSGHSDENALLLGNESYDYSSLKASISEVPSDVHVVMLDSCFSGNFIRAKGGQRQKSFLLDDSTVVQGHAYLSSSSESEASQESDTIQASFFTHAMVTGLRGAADVSGDNKVSLNELYYYAFNETLLQTELSTIGPQHPSYNITLVGSGDLVLTDISEAESVLVIPSETEGKYFIRTFDGILVSEVNKIKGNKVALALSEGYYSVTLIVGTVTQQSTIALKAGEQYIISGTDFLPVQTISGRARGGTAEEPIDITTEGDEEDIPELKEIQKTPVQATPDTESSPDEELEAIRQQALEEIRRIQGKTYDPVSSTSEMPIKNAAGIPADSGSDTTVQNAAGITYDYEKDTTYIENSSPKTKSLSGESPVSELSWKFFSISFLPGLGFPSPLPENVHVSISPFMASSKNVFGGQLGVFTASSTVSLRGLQVAGFSSSTDTLRGVQVSGFMNTAKDIMGMQYAGFMNTGADVIGGQAAGFMNIASGVKGFQLAGFMNIAGNGYGLQGSGFLNVSGGNYYGVQASGFLNIADEIKGVQIGIINIAKKNTGFAIGVLNFIVDGIMSPGAYWEKGNNLMFQYQGGTNAFFTTYMIGGPLGLDKAYVLSGVGIGTRFALGDKASLDIELLYKYVNDISLNNESSLSIENAALAGDSKKTNHIPSARATLNLSFFKHFTAFAALSADINIPTWNNSAFTYWDHSTPWIINAEYCVIYPSISAGVKF